MLLAFRPVETQQVRLLIVTGKGFLNSEMDVFPFLKLLTKEISTAEAILLVYRRDN